ncbi:MAG TPA: glutamate decarboxylase [Pirellulales bacterium]|jgi:glutamate decarboxylase
MKPLKHHSEEELAPAYASRSFVRPIPKYAIPEDGLPADVALQLVRDEMNLDGNPVMNLASFVTTWMEPQAERLLADTANKNLIDQDEYPQTDEIHQRVISMLARLFHAPKDARPMGTATVGSSEAIMLGLLAHKWAWRKRRIAEGKHVDRPNVVFGADVHTCWEKFALYFDVEARIVPLEPDCHILTAEKVAAHIDENTTAVGCILGTTFTGQIDEIGEINTLLKKIKRQNGWDIPIHVDGASGGFVAPFAYPDLAWDFRLDHVRSINASNHKFGLIYPGMGSVVFRDEHVVPSELIYKITYLGGEMFNYSLNFSKPSSQILLQYYNFLRLGRTGYRQVIENIMSNARYLEKKLLDTGRFELLNQSKYLPVVVVKLKDRDASPKTLYHLSDALRQRGWIVPAYPLPANAQETHVLRAVVKENFSRDLAEKFAQDVIAGLKQIDAIPETAPKTVPIQKRQHVC